MPHFVIPAKKGLTVCADGGEIADILAWHIQLSADEPTKVFPVTSDHIRLEKGQWIEHEDDEDA